MFNSCTNKAGEQISGMVEFDASGKIMKDIRRLYIQDGLIVKYEQDYEGSFHGVYKDELFFENGRFVKKVEKGKEYTWSPLVGSAILGSICGVTSGLPAPKQ